MSLTCLGNPPVLWYSQILRRGCHVNDRDGLTDMTLLHYACKAGAHGVGEGPNPQALSPRA